MGRVLKLNLDNLVSLNSSSRSPHGNHHVSSIVQVVSVDEKELWDNYY